MKAKGSGRAGLVRPVFLLPPSSFILHRSFGGRMSLWKIAWRSIQQRSLASSLTAVSMALGVALVVAVLVIHTVVYQSFNRGRGGYNLVVGATKGSRLELVLNAVYYMGQSAEPLPYEYYKKLIQGRAADGVETASAHLLGRQLRGFPRRRHDARHARRDQVSRRPEV